MQNDFECYEKYRWDENLGDYVLVVRVKQSDGCRLYQNANRYKRKSGQLVCPVLAGVLADCRECQWHEREKD